VSGLQYFTTNSCIQKRCQRVTKGGRKVDEATEKTEGEAERRREKQRPFVRPRKEEVDRGLADIVDVDDIFGRTVPCSSGTYCWKLVQSPISLAYWQWIPGIWATYRGRMCVFSQDSTLMGLPPSTVRYFCVLKVRWTLLDFG